jgi:4-hydroxy-3-methylbut-2-enyl diphosphate reductase
MEHQGVEPGRRTVLLASPRAFCAGVERAIEIVDRLIESRGTPIYVRKQIVHNVHVVAEFEAKGVVFVDDLAQVPSGRQTVVFSAHGVAPAVRKEAERRGLDIVDATCPLVTKVHREVIKDVARGRTVLLIGHAGHEETEGTLGEAPDRVVLVETPADVATLEISGPVSYVTQTTLAVDETREVIDALRERFPDIEAPPGEDICYASTNRQDAVRSVAADADVVLVVGSRNSANSNRLVEVARRTGASAYLVDDALGVDPAWLVGAEVVGVTAGASTAPARVDEVVEALLAHTPAEIVVRSVAKEDMTFALPKEVLPR